jgi:cytochrome c
MKQLLTIICIALLAACQPKQQTAEETQPEEIPMTHNTLTEEQQAEGWKLLFDGKTTSGWRNFKSDQIGAAWKIDDNALHFDNTVTDGGGDIITNDEYENFELMLEWKIDSCGNSGIMFNVVEDEQYQYVWQTGPEMQVLDNDCHPDAKIIKHRAGDLYDLISCSTETVKPAGEWNQVRIVSNQGNYEFWLNGTNVVNFTMHTPEWDAMVAGSKFKDMPAFGKATKGHISLQDHGDKVWFRNIMIRTL